MINEQNHKEKIDSKAIIHNYLKEHIDYMGLLKEDLQTKKPKFFEYCNERPLKIWSNYFKDSIKRARKTRVNISETLKPLLEYKPLTITSRLKKYIPFARFFAKGNLPKKARK